MDHREVLALFDRRMRQFAPADDPGSRVERTGCVVRQVGAGAGDWNGVVWSDLDEAGADAAIAAQVAYFGALGREFEWKTYSHDRPADLPGRLAAAGFVAEPPETLMIAEIAGLPTYTGPPEGIELRTVTDLAGVDLVADVHEQAFGTGAGSLRQRMRTQLADSPGTFSMTLAMAGDVPVSAARMEAHPGTGFAGLWGGGTVPGWRGRGIYRALVAHRARLAAERGCRYLQVDASPDSRPILLRLGFAALSTTTPWLRQP